MNPGQGLGKPSDCGIEERNRFSVDYNAIKSEFEKWIHKQVNEETARGYIRYLDKYLGSTIICSRVDLEDVLDEVKAGYNHFVKGLRNLIKFLEKKGEIPRSFAEELKELLKVRRTGTDTYVPPDEVVKQTLAEIDREEYEILFKLVGYSGIRVREARYLLETFDMKRLHFEDGIAYYDLEWNRGTKKSFKAFMPADFGKKLRRVKLTEYGITNYLGKRGVRPKHLRNWQANKLVRARIQESVINFIQGRSPNTVFATHYLAKVNEAIAAYKEVVKDLREILEG